MKKFMPMLIFILILGTILTTVLVAVSTLTEERIARNDELKQKRSVLEALDIAFTPETIESVYAASIKETQVEDQIFFKDNAGNTAFVYLGSGLWGPIEGVLTLAADLTTISGLAFIHQEETPGLGSRITEDPFKSSFLGKSFSPALTMSGSGPSNPDTDIDAITGATLSCNAFVEILNNNYNEKIPLIKGGQ